MESNTLQPAKKSFNSLRAYNIKKEVKIMNRVAFCDIVYG